jgi:hypothetical protein
VTELRDVVEDRWKALKASKAPSRTAMVTSPVPVETPQGSLLVGIDAEGRRHLLVPLGPRQSLEPDVTGRAVHLLVRPFEDSTHFRYYADLVLLDVSLAEVFTSLCEDVLVAVGRNPLRAVRALRQVLHAWRSLLAGAQGPLGPQVLTGLFGELSVLRTLLQKDSGVATSWHGPSGAAHDFHLGVNAIEVKVTTSPKGRMIQVHGTDQLEEPVGGTLMLVWFRLIPNTMSGLSVPGLIDQVIELADDALPIRRALADVGYREVDREIYSGIRYEIAEQVNYRISNGFPRIIQGSLTGDARLGGLSNLIYSVDLDSPSAHTAETNGFVHSFLGAS